MTKETIIKQLDALLKDCENGYTQCLDWDDMTWEAMKETVQNTIVYITKNK